MDQSLLLHCPLQEWCTGECASWSRRLYLASSGSLLGRMPFRLISFNVQAQGLFPLNMTLLSIGHMKLIDLCVKAAEWSSTTHNRPDSGSLKGVRPWNVLQQMESRHDTLLQLSLGYGPLDGGSTVPEAARLNERAFIRNRGSLASLD